MLQGIKVSISTMDEHFRRKKKDPLYVVSLYSYVKWQHKRVWLPKKCSITNEWLWLTKAYTVDFNDILNIRVRYWIEEKEFIKRKLCE